MKFSITGFFSKCDQVRNFLRIWPYLLKKSLMQTSFFVQCKSRKFYLTWFSMNMCAAVVTLLLLGFFYYCPSQICDALPDLVPFVRFKKTWQNTQEVVLLLVSNTPSWVFLTFFNLYKWCEIVQSVPYMIWVRSCCFIGKVNWHFHDSIIIRLMIKCGYLHLI